MKVLLVRPPAPSKLSFTNILDNEPLELEYLHTVLKAWGYEDRIYDAVCEKKSIEKVFREYKPEVVALSGYLNQENIIKRIGKRLKAIDPKVVIAVGGVHAQLNYQRFFDPAIDFILRSESVEAFGEVVRLVEEVWAKKPLTTELEKINGLCYPLRGKAAWQVNPMEPVDINDLPIPNRQFFDEHKERFRYLDLTPIASIKTSFSCPYDCNFCYCTLLHQGKYQVRDLDLVMEELQGINCDNIQIVDDDFLVDKNRLWDFIGRVKALGFKKTFICYARADFVSENQDIVEALVEIGFRYFLIGLEATSDEDLDKYNKRTKLSHNQQAVEVIRRAGGECIALMIVNLSARAADFQRIVDFVVDNQLRHVTVSMFTPIPGTPLFEQYKDRLISDRIEDWDFLHLVVEPELLSKREYYRQYKKMFLQLYRRAKKEGLYQFMDLPYMKRMLYRYLMRKIYLDR